MPEDNEKNVPLVNIFDTNLEKVQELCNIMSTSHTDCTLLSLVDFKKINVVGALISKHSNFIRRRLPITSQENQFTVIHIPTIESEILQILVEYAHTGQLVLSEKTVSKVLCAAVSLEMTFAVKECYNYVQEIFIQSNCKLYQKFAKNNDIRALQENAAKYMFDNFTAIVNAYEKDHPQKNVEACKLLIKEQITKSKDIQYEKDVSRMHSTFDMKITPYEMCLLKVRGQYTRVFDPVTNEWVCVKSFPKFTYDIHHVCIIKNEIVIIVGYKEDEWIIEEVVLKTLKKKLLSSEKHTEKLTDIPVTYDNENIYFVGGDFSKAMQKFVLKTRKYEPLKKMISSRKGHKVCYYKNRLFVFGGEIKNANTNTAVDCFDLNANQWYKCPPTNVQHHNSLSTVFGDHIYVVNEVEKDKITIERYSFASNSWAVLNPWHFEINFNASFIGVINKFWYILDEGEDTIDIKLNVFDIENTFWRKTVFRLDTVKTNKSFPRFRSIAPFNK